MGGGGVTSGARADVDARQTEGKSVAFKVNDKGFRITNSYKGEITWSYYTSDGTAKAGEDYKHTTGTVTTTKLSQSRKVYVTTYEDDIEEGTENFYLYVYNPVLSRSSDSTPRDKKLEGEIHDPDPNMKSGR